MIGCLFSGVGGLERGLEWATGQQVAWQCEYDKDASKVLAERWPGVPNLHDITSVDWADVDPVEIVCGGPPCQPTSSAGLRKGEADERWMWPAAIDAVRHLRPRWIVFENPPSLLALHGGRSFGRILAALAQMGYVGRWGCVRAADIGAPHRRERLFLVAEYARHTAGGTQHWQQPQAPPVGAGQSGEVGGPAHAADDRFHGIREAWNGRAGSLHSGGLATDATSHERWQLDRDGERAWGDYEPAVRRWEAVHGDAPVPVDDRGRLSPAFVEWMMGFPPGWVTDVAISRSAQLRCLGNAVVPQCAELAWQLLA